MNGRYASRAPNSVVPLSHVCIRPRCMHATLICKCEHPLLDTACTTAHANHYPVHCFAAPAPPDLQVRVQLPGRILSPVHRLSLYQIIELLSRGVPSQAQWPACISVRLRKRPCKTISNTSRSAGGLLDFKRQLEGEARA
jgi:hypothetical protein